MRSPENSPARMLVIELLIKAANSGQMVCSLGPFAHFVKVFTMVGIVKHGAICLTQVEALASLDFVGAITRAPTPWTRNN